MSKGIVNSHLFICHYSENFTNEKLSFHKMVYILPAVSRLGQIAGPVGTFVMSHSVALCTWHMSFPIPARERSNICQSW